MDVQVSEGGYRESEGAPIVRIAKHLGEMGRVIRRELELRGAESGRRLGSVRQEKKRS